MVLSRYMMIKDSLRMTAAWVQSNNTYNPDKGSDPFTLTIHFITDPGGSNDFKNLTAPLVKWCDPSFQLFNIAERSRANGFVHVIDGHDTIPSLCVLLFLEEELDSGVISEMQEYFTRAPWQPHHTDNMLRKLSTCHPNEQHFYGTAHDMPLWAVRQVHCGKRFLRFMIYSTTNKFQDMVRFYSIILDRVPTFQRDDNFCIFTVHSKSKCDIQFALKKTPGNFSPRSLNSAFLQFKVENIEGLVQSLPNICSPISSQRWQTTDPDGNVTLLLIKQNASKPVLTPRRGSIDVLQSLLTPKGFRQKKYRPTAGKRSLNTVYDSET
ncbi:protein FAM124A-like isoform X2 [Anneissia japonica]|uniref:protein FAM124A-like isoform X2 n=1 Tax=Anneissia japonica TaxID=1529436 RepID=UPI0014259792|nr:protein FAM124A-like isoform X2 [Anneissia japonica]